MSKSKIKTREKGKDIKVLDKSAVVGQRMKSAFIRSKKNAEALMDDRQATPNEYAVDKTELAADDLAHDAANVAASGTKTAVRQGRKLFQRQREKWAAEKRQENTPPAEQSQPPEPAQGIAPDGQRSGGTAPEHQRLPHHKRMAERPSAQASIEHPTDTTSSYVERGRAFAKKQAERKRQIRDRAVPSDRPSRIKTPNATQAPRQAELPVKTAKQPAQAMGQAAKDTGTGTKNTIKRAQRTIKTAQHTAKTAPRTAKTAIKTADHAAKTAQATARTARATAQAARVTAKATATTAKAAAKGASVAAKALLASVKALVTAIAAGGWVAILAIVVICLIGLIVASPFGIFFSGEDSGTGQTMPTVVREINQEYEGKLGEIESSAAHDRLELSGSRAVWPEVLAVYAVKTTTDPDDPQEVATMDDGKKELLKEIFWAMNEISHRTETATTTQTVETDDGKGNIMVEEVEVTATTLYITVTHKTVDEMADIYNFTADQREMLVELLAEESNGMWSAVLYGIGTGDREIVTVALSQLGNVGGRPYWSWYGFESRVDWCACFVSWCANECGYLDTGVIPRFASCSIGIQWFLERGLWQDRDYEPRPGDLIFFDWDDEDEGQDGAADHVGIVEKVDGGIVYTVEGNSGNACRERQYAIGHAEIYGYGTPAY